MKKSIILMMMLCSGMILSGQDITGDWNGALSVRGMQLRLVFHIARTDTGYTATMDSPDQGAKGIPVTSVTFSDPDIRIELTNLRAEYSGVFKDTLISGTFKQAGMSFPMDLTRKRIEKKAMLRPQEPKEPFPYHSEEVIFENKKDGIKLAGTLTIPPGKGKFPAVVLISGSGPQNRNEEIFGHKPFLVLADHLTRNGIAVLRFDDRGVGGSTGDLKSATSENFATDVESAVNYLLTRKEIHRKKIGLAGHSEGGIIAPMVAGKMKSVRFIVLMAGTSIRGDQLLLRQQELILRASGASEETIKRTAETNKAIFDRIIQSRNPETLEADLKDMVRKSFRETPESERPAGMSEEEFVSMVMTQLNNPWMLCFIRYDPAPALEKVRCPVLAINGEKDLQVPPGINLDGVRKGLEKGGNKKVTTHEFPGLNHLFQECKTGLPAEYAEIEQTMAPAVLEKISSWILEQVK